MTSITAAAPAGKRLTVGASLRRNRRWALYTSYFFLILFAIFFLLPPYYMIITAFKTDSEMAKLATNPWLITGGATLDQFRILLRDTDFLIFFKNTVIVTVCVVVITMVVSILAAFALGRMRFWGSSILATGIFLTYLVPDTLLFIPLFQIVKSIGLLNSYWAMVLVYPTLTVPFCTWIMIGYFQSIPKELDEAARNPIAEVIGFSRTLTYYCRRGAAEGLAAWYADEAHLPESHGASALALRKFYGLDDETIEYFLEHVRADIAHTDASSGLLDIYVSLAGTSSLGWRLVTLLYVLILAGSGGIPVGGLVLRVHRMAERTWWRRRRRQMTLAH